MLGRDFPQAVMRVLLAGASEAGFHGAMLATGLEVSLARCPWSGAVWWQAIVNGAKEFFISSTRSRHAIAKSLLEVRFACQAFGGNVLRSIINISF
jgi:hypothetical protein